MQQSAFDNINIITQMQPQNSLFLHDILKNKERPKVFSKRSSMVNQSRFRTPGAFQRSPMNKLLMNKPFKDLDQFYLAKMKKARYEVFMCRRNEINQSNSSREHTYKSTEDLKHIKSANFIHHISQEFQKYKVQISHMKKKNRTQEEEEDNRILNMSPGQCSNIKTRETAKQVVKLRKFQRKKTRKEKSKLKDLVDESKLMGSGTALMEKLKSKLGKQSIMISHYRLGNGSALQDSAKFDDNNQHNNRHKIKQFPNASSHQLLSDLVMLSSRNRYFHDKVARLPPISQEGERLYMGKLSQEVKKTNLRGRQKMIVRRKGKDESEKIIELADNVQGQQRLYRQNYNAKNDNQFHFLADRNRIHSLAKIRKKSSFEEEEFPIEGWTEQPENMQCL